MLLTMNEHVLSDHLMEIAQNSTVRHAVYEHLGEYCHQVRNRLNSLKLCLYLAKRNACESSSPEIHSLESGYASLERTVDLIQTLCRPMPISLALLGIDLLIDDRRPIWTRHAAELDVEVECLPPSDRAVAKFDPDRMGHALDVLVRWRLAELGPGSSARLTWRIDRGRALVTWQEMANPSTLSHPRYEPSHVWALPLITRIAEGHWGVVRILPGDRWRLDLDWPVAPERDLPRSVHRGLHG